MFKKGLKIFYLLFIANIMSFFIIMSFNVIISVAFTEQTGYHVYGIKEGSEEQEFLYTHYFEDGEDKKLKGYEDKGYELSTPSIRSTPSKSTTNTAYAIAGSICVIMACALIYNEMWKYGDKDRTAVKYKGQTENKLKGFWVGAIATSPAIVLLLILTILKSSISKSVSLLLYGLVNTYLYDFIVLIANGDKYFGDFSILQILIIFLLLLIVPIASGISYFLGYSEISIGEKVIYKKN